MNAHEKLQKIVIVFSSGFSNTCQVVSFENDDIFETQYDRGIYMRMIL